MPVATAHGRYEARCGAHRRLSRALPTPIIRPASAVKLTVKPRATRRESATSAGRPLITAARPARPYRYARFVRRALCWIPVPIASTGSRCETRCRTRCRLFLALSKLVALTTVVWPVAEKPRTASNRIAAATRLTFTRVRREPCSRQNRGNEAQSGQENKSLHSAPPSRPRL